MPASPFLSRSRWITTLAVFTAVLIILDGWCLLGLPFPMDGDPIGFMPQTVEYKATGRLINPLYHPDNGYGPEEDGRYIWHGLLYPMLTAKLLPSADYPSVALILFCYEVIILVCLAWAFSRLPVTNVSIAVGILSSLLVCTAWLSPGRPELMISLWLAMGLVAWPKVSVKWQPIVAGTVIGLVAATSPLPAVYLSLLYGIYVLMTDKWRENWFAVCLAIPLAATLFLLPFSVYPYTMREWVEGMLFHSQNAVINRPVDWANFAQGWIICSSYPLAIFWVGLFGLLGIRWMAVSFRQSRTWITALGLLAGVALVGIILRTAPDQRSYNVVALAPLFLFLAQLMLWEWLKESSNLRKQLMAAFLAVMALLSAVSLFRDTLLRFHTSDGLTRTQAETIVHQLLEKHPTVDFSTGLFLLIDKPQRRALLVTDYVGVDAINSTEDIVLIQQINPYKATPPRYSNYTLVTSYFTSTVPRFCGIALAHSPRGYNFAVYKKN